MKQRTRKPLRPTSRDFVLLLWALVLIASLLLRFRSPGEMREAGPPLQNAEQVEATSDTEERRAIDAGWLEDTFEEAERMRFRSSRRDGRRAVEVEAFGPPEELILSLYAVASTLRLGHFRLSREAEGGYRLFLEAHDE